MFFIFTILIFNWSENLPIQQWERYNSPKGTEEDVNEDDEPSVLWKETYCPGANHHFFLFSYMILLIQRRINFTKSWKIFMSALFSSWLISTFCCPLFGHDIQTRVRSRTIKWTCNAGLLREKSFPTSLVVDAFSIDLVHRLGHLRTVWKKRVNIHY